MRENEHQEKYTVKETILNVGICLTYNFVFFLACNEKFDLEVSMYSSWVFFSIMPYCHCCRVIDLHLFSQKQRIQKE